MDMLLVQVAEMILDGRELEFYKWDGELSELLAAVKANLNKVAEVRTMNCVLLSFHQEAGIWKSICVTNDSRLVIYEDCKVFLGMTLYIYQVQYIYRALVETSESMYLSFSSWCVNRRFWNVF